MSYEAISQLTNDVVFGGRVTAAATEQANIFKDDARGDFVALADAMMRGDAGPTWTFIRVSASGPGIGDKVDQGDGTIDQSLVTDADLLALVQGAWETVAALYFAEDGTPL